MFPFLHRLCLSITDFHPDTWNPAWSVSTILTGLLSFMVEKGPTLGSIETSDYTVIKKTEKIPYAVYCHKRPVMFWIFHVSFVLFSQKRQLSAQSLAFNLKDKVFCELFPDVVDVRIMVMNFSLFGVFFYVRCIVACGLHWDKFISSLT